MLEFQGAGYAATMAMPYSRRRRSAERLERRIHREAGGAGGGGGSAGRVRTLR